MGNQLKIFTWYLHPNYLFYLAQGNYTIYIPSKPKKTVDYYYKGEPFPFDENVIEIPSDEVKLYQFDCVVFQNIQNYLNEQFEILSEKLFKTAINKQSPLVIMK